MSKVVEKYICKKKMFSFSLEMQARIGEWKKF